jgi:hypothetical protein
MVHNIFQNWPLDKFIVWKDLSDEADESIPLLGQLIDNSWNPPDLPVIVNYLDAGRVHSSLVGSDKSRCQFCGAYAYDRTLVRSDGTWNWPDLLSHLVAEHSIRLPDSFVAHIRKEVDQHVGIS